MERSDVKPKYIGLWLNSANLRINTWLNREADVLLPLIFIAFKTNQGSKERRLE